MAPVLSYVVSPNHTEWRLPFSPLWHATLKCTVPSEGARLGIRMIQGSQNGWRYLSSLISYAGRLLHFSAQPQSLDTISLALRRQKFSQFLYFPSTRVAIHSCTPSLRKNSKKIVSLLCKRIEESRFYTWTWKRAPLVKFFR